MYIRLALVMVFCGPMMAIAAPKVLDEAALAPIKLGRKDAEARALIRLKKWKEAAPKITAKTPEARLVKGIVLHRAKQHTAAIAALKGLESQLPVVADRVRLTRADALLALERFEGATAEARKVGGGGALQAQARRLIARALREADQTDAARIAYTALVEGDDAASVPGGLLGLARLEADAHPKVALEALRRLDLEHPAHWTAREGRRLAARLIADQPTLAKPWAARSAEQQITRAERLMKRSRNTAVVDALKDLDDAELGPDLRCRREYALGRSLRKLRKWKRAAPILNQAVRTCTDAKSELASWARYVAGQAAERLSQEEAAADIYREQLRLDPKHRLADDAGYFLTRHLIEDKEDLDAAQAAARKLARTTPNGDMVPHALFYVAAQAMVQGRDEIAQSMLEADRSLPPRDPNFRDAGRASYWRARLAQKAGRKREAARGFESVIATQPLSWYAILAYSRLREISRKRARKFAKKALSRGASGPGLPGAGGNWRVPIPQDIRGPAWERARLLARLGMGPEAWSALSEAGAGGARADLLWLSAFTLDRAGAYNLSHDILRRKLPEFRHFAPSGAYRKHWQIAFPRPYASLVKAAAKETDVDRYFIWAIMREESAFTPTTESWANAMGLMQLIMPTAKRMAKAGERVNRTTVKNPALNVRLGARYLARVMQTSRAVLPLIPAGYNAGGGALKRWMKARKRLPLDLFVELIPYEEARGYTKRVISSYATYRYLYGKKRRDPLPYLSQSLSR